LFRVMGILILILISFVVGILLGLTRKFEFLKKYKLVTIITVILLFVMGFEIGSDNELFEKLPEIGFSALVIALAGILGSVVFTSIFDKFKNKYLEKKKNQ